MSKDNSLEFDYKYGFSMPQKCIHGKKGLSEDIVRGISSLKSEPAWMLDYRVKAYHYFLSKDATVGRDLSKINFDDITYFIRATDKQVGTWEELPDEIKNTYDRIGVPEAEKNS